MASTLGIRHGRRFRMRYAPVLRQLLWLLGMGANVTVIELSDFNLRVRMGWAFRADIPITSIRKIRRENRGWWGVGVHGWGGDWLVNGSPRGVVGVTIDPPAPSRVIGFPVKLRKLYISVENPDEFIAAVPVQDYARP